MGTVLAFSGPSNQKQVTFQRLELNRIVDLYGRMVAAGVGRIMRSSSARTRQASTPSAVPPRARIRIEKRPRQHGAGALWALIGETGQILRRGPELGPVLAPVERRLLKLVGQ